LHRLIARTEHYRPKAPARWQRDLIFAAELAEDRRWERLAEAGADVGPLQRELIAGLVELLEEQGGTLASDERIRAGYALGHLGDPRPDPTRADYWCAIPAGPAVVDGPEVWVDAFQIGRYPVTWAEWALFMKEALGIALVARPHPNRPASAYEPVAPGHTEV